MLEVFPLAGSPIERIRGLYDDFCACAKETYRWDLEPVDFGTLQQALGHGMVTGYGLWELPEQEPVGFMLYRLEEHRAIEINLIYAKPEVDPKRVLAPLMSQFIEDIKKLPGWDVVSYAMLGKQEDYIRTITWYGFKPMGQAILKFDIMDSITLQIMQQQSVPTLPEGYQLDSWKPQYAGGVAETLYESFSQAADALWDPRFRSQLGTRRIVGMLTAGEMGNFLGDCTTVLLQDGLPVGVCFLVQTGMGIGNVPLIGVRPSQKSKGFGNLLLKTTLQKAIQSILDGKIGLLEVTATMETDNLPAIKMYRRMGFREDYNYPHVYLPQEKLATVHIGQWCQ